VQFTLANADDRTPRPSPLLAGLATTSEGAVTGGLLHVRAGGARTLGVAVDRASGVMRRAGSYYELDGDLRLTATSTPAGDEAAAWIRANVAIPPGVVEIDAASVLVIDDAGRRWRLPKSDPSFDRPGALGPERIDREVCTERDLFNCHGTFYELPAENAGGFAKIRPICTHDRRIHDYCSYRGLLVMTGVADGIASQRIVRSADGHAAVWVGVVDDLWEFGRPRGSGGPWQNTPVRARVLSDAYLMSGYEHKTLTLRHDRPGIVVIDAQIDLTGDGLWCTWRRFQVPPGDGLTYEFPAAFSAYWFRVVADTDCAATAVLMYA